MQLNTTEELIEEIRQGRMVILMDDEDRENEGDLVIAAQCVRPEDINFIDHPRPRSGLPDPHPRALRAAQAAVDGAEQRRRLRDQLTLSIEAARGVTTGISAADRAVTIHAAVKSDARPEDLVQPGHIFPLMAQPGGVLSRAGPYRGRL